MFLNTFIKQRSLSILNVSLSVQVYSWSKKYNIKIDEYLIKINKPILKFDKYDNNKNDHFANDEIKLSFIKSKSKKKSFTTYIYIFSNLMMLKIQ